MALSTAEEKKEVLVLLTSPPVMSHVLNSNFTLASFRVSDVHTTLQWTKYADRVQAKAVTFFQHTPCYWGVLLSQR